RLDASQFDIFLEMVEAPDRFLGALDYDVALFDRPTIERFGSHFLVLLGAATRNPDVPLFTLPLMTESERQRVLAEWNGTPHGIGPAACVHELFEAQVDRTPEAVALVFADSRVTYAELDARANSVAWGLRDQGVRPGEIVAILLPRAIDVIVAQLGILK